MDTAELLEAYRKMLVIRCFEERVGELYRDAKIPGFVHTSIGQEACAVGVVHALNQDDMLTSTHRGHGHCLARGMKPDRMLAELYGKVDGYCRGKGGSMHVADPSVGVLGANGIVGAGLPIAVGAGFAAQQQGSGVAVAFFGEGATATGSFHEALTVASLRRLPVLFVCENNSYVEFSRWENLAVVDDVIDMAPAYGIVGYQSNGNDVEAVFDLTTDLVGRARNGEGPFLVELKTFRRRGHYEGDLQNYRQDELGQFSEVDPIPIAHAKLVKRGVPESDLKELAQAVNREIEAADSFAADSDYPSISEVVLHV